MKGAPIVSVKTNLVSWAGITPDFERTTFMPNLSAEVFFPSRWSLQASATYAYWDFGKSDQFWGLSAYSLEPRYWPLGDEDSYNWLYIGPYGQCGDYDTRLIDEDANGTMNNRTGTYWQAGLSAGCYIPLTPHIGVEVGLRGGYRRAVVKNYEVEESETGRHYFFRSKERKNHLGVTGLNASISYRF